MPDILDQWLAEHGLSQYVGAFRDNDVTFDVLSELSDDDLVTLGVSLGHRKKLRAALETRAPRRARLHTAAALADRRDERRLLTVMFADLAGSTRIAEELDPEVVRELLRAYRISVGAAIVRYDGHIANFVGDGIIAYFGWPRAYEDQAERAVRAAIDAVVAVGAIDHAYFRLSVRVGIATGQVVVGELGSEARSDPESAVGNTPNLAARLQTVALSNSVVVDPTTARLIEHTFYLEPLGPQELKGFSRPVDAWQVSAEKPAASRFEASHRTDQSPLVGRDTELAELRRHWGEAKCGRGGAVRIVGEAGIGKSKLVEAFRQAIGADPRTGLRWQCSAHQVNVPLHPVVARLSHIAGISPHDPPHEKLDKLERLIGLATSDVGRFTPIFAALLQIPFEARYGPLDLSGPQLRRRTIEELLEIIMILTAQQPALMVVEDAHWADPSTHEFFATILPRLKERPILLLVTERPGPTMLWAAGVTTLELVRLDESASTQLVRNTARERLAAASVERIVERGEGVPLFLEELTRSALESVDDDAVPTTLQALLVSRLDRLVGAKRLAQVGSVIGRDFPLDLATRMIDDDGAALDQAIESLASSDLVSSSHAQNSVILTFRHALIHDAVYSTLLLSERRELHRRILSTLETDPRMADHAEPEALARHAAEAAEWAKAFGCYRMAGDTAVRRSALREAISQFKEALSAARQLPPGAISANELIDLHFELRNALWAVGSFAEILMFLDEAERLATEMGDERRLGWVAVYRGASLWQVGRSAEAVAAAQHGILIAAKTGDIDLRAASDFYLGCCLVTSGALLAAEEAFQRVVDGLTGERESLRCGLPFAPALIARSWKIWTLAERGAFEEGAVEVDAAVTRARRFNQPFGLAHVLYDVGYFELVKGDYDAAVGTLRESAALIDRWGLLYLAPFTKGFLGYALALRGDVDEGVEMLSDAHELFPRLGLGLFRALVGAKYAHGLLLIGDADKALAVANEASGTARERGERGHEAFASFVLAAIYANRRDAESMLQAGETLARAERLGMYPLAERVRDLIGVREPR